VALAKQAGEAIMQVYAQTDLQIEVKQDDSPVTEIGRAHVCTPVTSYTRMPSSA